MSYAKIHLEQIPSPRILAGNENINYRDPTAIYHDGMFRLFFTVNYPRNKNRSMVSVMGTSTSRDLINWSPVKLLTAENPEMNYCSPGNIIHHNGEWIMCLCSYPIPNLNGFIGDHNSRAYIMRSKDLNVWEKPELLKIKGSDISQKNMGRIIDPYIIEDKDCKGKWWCTYKQDGVSISYSHNLEEWTYVGHHEAGENTCILTHNDNYYMFHCPGDDGMGLKRSKDMQHWTNVIENNITLGYKIWPWAMARLTAGFVLDLTKTPSVGKYLMFFHATQSSYHHEHIGSCSLGIAWSDDLIHWSWPKL